MKSYDWHNVRGRLGEALKFIPEFAQHPVRGMRTLPDWDWPTILILQAAFAALTTSVGSLIARNWVLAITSLLVAPLTYLIINAVVTAIFFYIFKFGFKRDVPYRQIYLSSVFASVPGHVLLMGSRMFPPVMLLGALTWSVLIYVSCTDTFHLPRKSIRNLLALFFVIYAGVTVRQFINTKSHNTHLKERTSPESLDILEKELNPHDAN